MKLKSTVAAVAGVFMIVPTIGVAGNDAVLDLTADQSVVDLPEGGVIDATGPDYRTGIAGIANGVNRIDATLKGPSLLVKVDEYDPDSTGGWTTYGIQARQGATINVGTSEEPLSKFEIQNHGKTTLSTGLMSWRGPNGTLADAHINVNSDIVDIQVSSDEYWAYGLYTYNNSTDQDIADEERSSIVINAKYINIDASSEAGPLSAGMVVWSQAKVKLDADRIKVKAYRVINTRGDAIVEINADAKKDSVVQLDGNIAYEYDGASSGTPVDAKVVINLTSAESYWNGNLECTYSNLDPKKLEAPPTLLNIDRMFLGLANGAQWTPTAVEVSEEENDKGQLTGSKRPALSHLALNGGVVNVTGEDIAVTVANLTGEGGTINLAADLSAEEGKQAGTFMVENASENAALTVKLKNADMTQDLTADDVTPEQAEGLVGNVGGNVESRIVVDEGMYNDGFDVTDDGSTVTHGPNSVMQSTLELAAAAPLALNRILTNDVHKRMGDIRSMKRTSGAWVRYDGGRLSAESGLDNDFHTIQVGVDTVPAADAPRFGLAFSYTKSDADYSRGEADMDAYSLAAYGLWMGDAGQFVDVVARLGTAKTDMTVDGNKKGSMDNIVTALSGEFGWRFDLAKNFYVEPQVELAYTHVDADSLSLSDGSTYRFDDADSLMGRAGFALGLQCPENGNTAYLRVSAVHEFLGDAAVTGGNGAVYEIDGKDTWVEYGLGANFHLTDTTYVWADVERTAGSVLDTDWRATVGVRHSF